MFNRILFSLSIVFCSGFSFAGSDYNFTPTYEPADKSYKVPLIRDGRSKLPFIEVRVNGHKGVFLFDTGTRNTVISEKFARKIDLEVKPSSIKGKSRELVTVNTVSVGGIDFKDFDLFSLKLNHLDNLYPFDFDGILGGNVLRLYPLKIDFVNNYVEFNSVFETTDFYDFRLRKNKVYIPAVVNGFTYTFLLDTGAKSIKVSNALLDSVDLKNRPVKNIMTKHIDVSGVRKEEARKTTFNSFSFLNKALTGLIVRTGSSNLISMDVLNNEIILLDYKNKKIKLSGSL